MAATSKATSARAKAKKFQRATEKRYRWVQFTHSLFGEDVFELPALGQMSNGVVERLNVGDFAPFYKWLADAGVEGDALDAMRTLDQEEFQAFQEDWQDGVTVPKS